MIRVWKSRVYQWGLDIEPEQFDFIGTTERYDESIDRFNKRFGLNLKATCENVTSLNYQLSESERAEAARLLASEICIYQKFQVLID